METKPFYTSKEVYVLLIAIIVAAAQVFGVGTTEIVAEGVSQGATLAEWATLTLPALALILRLFWTKTKLTLV